MYLDEVSPKDWSESQLYLAINNAYHELYTDIVTVYEDYNVTTEAIALSDYQYFASLPEDFYKSRMLVFTIGSGSNYSVKKGEGKMFQLFPNELAQEENIRQVGSNTLPDSIVYSIYGNSVYWYPLLKDVTEKNITLTHHYIPTLTDLTISSPDLVSIPYVDRYYQIICLDAAASLLRKGQQEEASAARYKAESELMRGKMMQELEDRNLDSQKEVIETTNYF